MDRTVISVVVPAYNECMGIGSVIKRLLDLAEKDDRIQEVIVVDDGSLDTTKTTVTDFPQVKLICHPTNQGYGAALKTGIKAAVGEIVCIVDADGTYPVDSISALADHLLDDGFDMVVGARTGERVEIPLVRKPAKWAITRLAQFIAQRPIPDLNSGLRVFHRSAILPLFSMLPNGFSFTTTTTLGMMANDYLVGFVPINYHRRVGTSKIHPIRDTLNFVKLIALIGLYFSPLRIFLPLSCLLLLSAISIGLLSAFVFGKLLDVTVVMVAMAGLQMAALGLLAELINRRTQNVFKREN